MAHQLDLPDEVPRDPTIPIASSSGHNYTDLHLVMSSDAYTMPSDEYLIRVDQFYGPQDIPENEAMINYQTGTHYPHTLSSRL